MSHLACRWRRLELLEAVFDQLSDAVLLYDEDLYVEGANRAAERLLGMMAEEMIGKHCRDLFHCSSCDPTCGMRIAAGSSTVLPTGTVRLHLNNGRQRTVAIRTVRLHDESDGVHGVVATITDISEESQPAVPRIIAESQPMLDLIGFIRKVATSEAATVLIEGENGTGKDVIAKVLHHQSRRQAEPFLAINCAAIPETLLESELFGHEKGAFTDARAQKRGLFELADTGTLFLDEIGELPLSLQAKLLRVLESQTFRRLGGIRDIKVDVRIIAATNRNLLEAVKEGAFRQDLFYRLNVVEVVVPALRERPQDILPLARFFIEHYNAKFKRQIDGISSEAENLMLTYTWPGNVRELRNAIERAIILEDTAYIQPRSLHLLEVHPAEWAYAATAGADSGSSADASMSLLAQERRLVGQALERTHGNQSQAARLLRITRDTLRYKMKKFDLYC